MRPQAMVIAKPNDPPWPELAGEINSVISHRFAHDPDAYCGPRYLPTDDQPGFAFASLNREDQRDLLAEFVEWRLYESRGISVNQQRIVMANVLDGKPQEKWLDGVFDEAVLQQDKIASFRAMVQDSENSSESRLFEETDGKHLPWSELSATARLQYIARDAAIAGVPFEPFAELVKKTIGDAGEAAMRVVLESQKELHAIAKLLPDDARTEPTPLVDQIKDMMDYLATVETQHGERLPGHESLRERIVAAAAEDGKLSLKDLRRGAQREQRGVDQSGKSKEAER